MADPGFPNGGGGKDEAPQAPRSSRRRREDRGAEVERRRREDRGVPLPRNFFDFSSEKEWVSVHYGKYFITVQLPFLQQKKNSVFGFQNLQNESTACKERANSKTTVGNNICMKWNGLSGVSGPNMTYLKMKPHNLLQQLSKFVIYSTLDRRLVCKTSISLCNQLPVFCCLGLLQALLLL